MFLYVCKLRIKIKGTENTSYPMQMICVYVCVRIERHRERKEYKPMHIDLERFPKWIKKCI